MNTKTIKQKIEAMLNRQVILGVETIFSAIYSGPQIKTLSFHHILNRVMMLVQLPVTFVVMQYNKSRGYEEYFRTNLHSRHKADIDNSIKHSNRENYFPLWHTAKRNDFFLLVLIADRGGAGWSFPPLIVNDSIVNKMDLWMMASYKLKKVFDSENYDRYPGFTEAVHKIIESTKKNSDKTRKTVSKNKFQTYDWLDSIKDDFDEKLLRSNTNFKFDDLRRFGVIDKVFSKIKKNLLDVNNINHNSDNAHSPTNFMLFARDYWETPNKNWRHDDYSYSLRIMVCDSQKEELKRFLKGFLQEEPFLRNEYKKELRLVNDKAAKRLALDAETEFWSYLKKGDEGINILLEILSEYLGEKARSMADPVFDGVSFHRQPFANDGGMARCFNEGEALPHSFSDIPPKSVTRHDLIRVVLCQHLFDGMAATPNNGCSPDDLQLQIMLNPVEIGGRLWGVVAYATRSFPPNTLLTKDEDIDNYEIFWLKNYHIYRDVNERMKKNLRSYMDQLYESSIARIYTGVMSQFQESTANHGISDLVDEINQQLRMLSCVFPYAVLEVDIRHDDEELPFPNSNSEEGLHRALAGKNWAAHVGVDTKLSPFPVAPGVDPKATGIFVDKTDVAVAMSEELLRAAVTFSKSNQQDQI